MLVGMRFWGIVIGRERRFYTHTHTLIKSYNNPALFLLFSYEKTEDQQGQVASTGPQHVRGRITI